MSLKSQLTRASNFQDSLSPLDNDIRFTLTSISKPHESIDALMHQEENTDIDDTSSIAKDLKRTQVEEEQFKYNSTIDRVRTPPPIHNYGSDSSA
jgi:hypothetical protein